MTAHPNRSKTNRRARANPTPAEVRRAREAVGLTQSEAAALIYSTLRAWENWEAGADLERGRRMHPGLFELFLIKSGQIRAGRNFPHPAPPAE